MIKPNFMNMV